MALEIFLTFMEISLSVGLTSGILLALSPILEQRYAGKWRYWLWAALAVRLFIPVNINIPEYHWSLTVPGILLPQTAADGQQGYATDDETGSGTYENEEKKGLTSVVPSDKTPVRRTSETIAHGISQVWQIIPIVWLTGVIVYLCLSAILWQINKKRIFHKTRTIQNNSILDMAKNLSLDIGLHKKTELLTGSKEYGPMAVGLISPVIILPDCKYTQDELLFILKHELLHIKRRDHLYKLLLLLANAVHWFNPVIYRMVRAANTDLEMACDEDVIKNTSFAGRKAYAEVIFTALSKQKGRDGYYTTHFYRDTKFMKKRFRNILKKKKGRRGMLLLSVMLLLTLTTGSLIACTTPTGAAGTDMDSPIRPEENETPDAPIPREIPTRESEQTTETTMPDEPAALSPELSEDAQKIKTMTEEFLTAYFNADLTGLQGCLTDPYEWDITVYDNPQEAGMITDTSLKGLSDIGVLEENTPCVISFQYKVSPQADYYRCLTIEFVRTGENFYIQFYGEEG